MKRSTLDRVISSIGVVLAAVMLVVGLGLLWASNFIHGEVKDQLSAQRITFPAAGSEQLAALDEDDELAVSKYAGEALVTGKQAKVYSDNYINAHLQTIGGGQTYSELSTASRANPDDKALAGKVDTVFRGETLRGLLLNAYAFDTMATVARYGAFISFAGAIVLAGLSLLGFRHAGTVKTTKRRS